MDYFKFTRWVSKEESNLVLPDHCRIAAPPTVINFISVRWTFFWCFHFEDDGRYLRIWEHYDKKAGLIGISRRISFSHHYGPVTHFRNGVPLLDEHGVFIYENTDPVEIRIDTCGMGGVPHLHFGAPNPHYQQGRIEGLVLETVDMFTFIRAILRHRKTGKPLNEVLGFRII